jgi:hypothetical protein
MGNSLHWGTWRGGSFTGDFERQQYLGFFFLEPEVVRSLSLGQSGTEVKEQGSRNLASECGAQRACLKA